MNELREKSDDELVEQAGRIKGSDSAEAAHAEMMRRFNRSTEKYSKILVAVAFAQLAVVFVQVLIMTAESPTALNYILLLGVILVVYLMFRFVDKDIFKKN